MKAIATIAAALLLAAVAHPASAATKCDDDLQNFWQKLMEQGSFSKMSGARIADVTRRTTRAYDACQAGDTFSVHGLWDEIARQNQDTSKKQ